MTQPSVDPQAPQGAEGTVVEAYYKRMAPHAEPVHLDEYAAAALASIFPAQAEKRWPGITSAEFLPFGMLDDFRALRDDPRVLKLGWGGTRERTFPDVVDEHSLPDEERQGQCTSTLMAELLGLDARERFKLKPVLEEVLESDKRGRKPQNSMHLADLLMAPFSNGETYQGRLKIVTWAVKKVMAKQGRYLDAAEKLQPSVWQILGPKAVEVHAINYADPSEFEQFEGAVTAVCRTRGAKMVVIRNPDGHIQVIGDPQKKLPMQDVAVAMRALECHLRQRSLPPLEELRRKGTIPEVPEWHFSDSGNVLNGGQAQPWIPATLIQLDALRSAIGHALDAAWMKTHGFAT